MSIVVIILLFGKRGLFWIVYNNYSMKAVERMLVYSNGS